KWHLGTLHARSATSPGSQGFDTWLSSPNFYENDPLFSRQGTVVETSGESSAVTVDAALAFIESAVEKRQPFAAVVWFGNPHVPHKARDELKQLYPGEPANMQNYWGEITGIDRAVAKLRQRLRTLGIAENTLLLFTSDNGAMKPGSTGGLRGTKGTNYEGGLRVPAVLEWPRRCKQPLAINTPCCTVDILPTVLAAAGVSYPQPARPLDGQNLGPIINGQTSVRSSPLGFWTYPMRGQGMKSSDLLEELRKQIESGKAQELPPISPAEEKAFAAKYPSDSFLGHAAWIDGRFKLHRLPRANGGDDYALYDLAADAQETTDLAATESERVTAMAKQLEAWQRSVLNSLNGGDYHK
ncbi:MAG: sulfatase-like hydrolase/transferase, partial [Planctomycetaceae bacterium]|nr:sulfatase-like hydrolase/transferase [Planctomycetaceae bacterium]